MAKWIILPVMALSLIGCGSEESRLVGTWNFVPLESKPDDTPFSRIFNANINMKLTLREDGTYTETTDAFMYGDMEVPAYSSEGVWTIDDGEFTKTEKTQDGKRLDDSTPRKFTLSSSGDRLEGTNDSGGKLTYLKQ